MKICASERLLALVLPKSFTTVELTRRRDQLDIALKSVLSQRC